jgi:hypothetical protein
MPTPIEFSDALLARHQYASVGHEAAYAHVELQMHVSRHQSPVPQCGQIGEREPPRSFGIRGAGAALLRPESSALPAPIRGQEPRRQALELALLPPALPHI